SISRSRPRLWPTRCRKPSTATERPRQLRFCPMDQTHEVEILLVEDSPEDVELTMRALTSRHLANQLFVCRDGAEAIDFFFGAGPNALREIGVTPKVIILDLQLPTVAGLALPRPG